jgi:hypothetical protein
LWLKAQQKPMSVGMGKKISSHGTAWPFHMQ